MTKYTDRITSEHAKRPKFVATVAASTASAIDQQSVMAGLPAAFDLDTAVGAQLDVVGLWVGASRNVSVPITGVYFSFDTTGLGFDQGYWQGPYDPVAGLTVLPDAPYRLLIRSTIALNYWDGTIQSAIDAISPLFPANLIYIQDNQDMSITVLIGGPPLDAISLALLTGGYLALKPVGVRINYIVPSVANTNVFGFDVSNSLIGGFDSASWGVSP